jgi:O-antigen/teichoic acid export membrane protein
MKQNKRFIDVIYLSIQPLIINVIGVPAAAYFIRRLGPSGFGQWMLATSLVTTLSFIANLGLRTRFVRTIAQFPENTEVALAEQLGLRFLLSCVAAILAMTLCSILKYPVIVFHCVMVAAFGATLSVLAGTLIDVLQAFQQFKSIATNNFITGIFVTAVTVIAIWRGADAFGLSVAYLAAPATSLIGLGVIVQKHHCQIRIRINKARYHAMLTETSAQGVQQFVGTVQERVEQFLLPKIIGIAGFGYFAASTILPNRLAIVPDSIITFYYPTISRYSNENENQAKQYVVQLLWIALLACIPIAIMVFNLAPCIAVILFRSRPDVCTGIIRVTIWSVPLLAVQYSISCALQAAGRIRQTAQSTTWAAALNMIIAYGLVSQWGLQGACWSWLIRPAVTSLILLPGFCDRFPDAIKSVPVATILFSSTVMAIPLILCVKQEQALLLTLAETVLAILIYILCLVLLRVPQAIRQTLHVPDGTERHK